MTPTEPPRIRCEFDSLEEPIRGWRPTVMKLPSYVAAGWT